MTKLGWSLQYTYTVESSLNVFDTACKLVHVSNIINRCVFTYTSTVYTYVFYESRSYLYIGM
jgi:hypothetical protein